MFQPQNPQKVNNSQSQRTGSYKRVYFGDVFAFQEHFCVHRN